MVTYMTPGRAHNAGKKLVWMILGIYFLANVIFLEITSFVTKLQGDERWFVLCLTGSGLIGSLSSFLAWREERKMTA